MKFTAFLFIVLTSAAAFCQQDSLYRIKLSAGGGWGFRISRINVPNTQLDVSTSSPAGSLRLMWKPEHMLSVGVESGYIPITQVKSKAPIQPDEEDGNANLAAIPILLFFSMDKYGAELSAGVGVYSLMVSGKSSKGKGIENSAIELGYSFSGSYIYTISQRFGIGIDLKYYVFTDRQIAMLIPQLSLRWTVMAY